MGVWQCGSCVGEWRVESVVREIAIAKLILGAHPLVVTDVGLQCPAGPIGVALLHRAKRPWFRTALFFETTAT